MWKYVENSNSDKPVEIEHGLTTVYLRKDFEFHEKTEDRNEHWSYQEMEIDKKFYPIYEMMMSRIEELENKGE